MRGRPARRTSGGDRDSHQSLESRAVEAREVQEQEMTGEGTTLSNLQAGSISTGRSVESAAITTLFISMRSLLFQDSAGRTTRPGSKPGQCLGLLSGVYVHVYTSIYTYIGENGETCIYIDITLLGVCETSRVIRPFCVVVQ